MLKVRLFLLGSFLPLILWAQNPNRYQKTIFDSIVIKENLAYAKYKPSFWKGLFSSRDSVALAFDFYEGKGDELGKRPLVILAHGGAFVKGSNKDKHITVLAESLALKGYAVASIAYRLREYPSLLKAGYLGVQDARAAIRFFRANALKFKIHPDYIFFGGVSAGGVMALHTAYLDDGEAMAGRDFKGQFACLDCFGAYKEFSSEIQGVISIAGALIDTTCIQRNDQVPSIHFHGTNDAILDYEKDLPLGQIMSSYNDLVGRIMEEVSESENLETWIESAKMPEVYGSRAIVEQLSRKGISHELVTFAEDNHYLMVNKKGKPLPSFFEIDKRTSQFLYNIIKPENSMERQGGIEEAIANHEYKYTAPEGFKNYNWDVEGGEITKRTSNRVSVRWDKEGQGILRYRLGNEMGAFTKVQNIKVEIMEESTLQQVMRLCFDYIVYLILASLAIFLVYYFGKKSRGGLSDI